MPRRVMIGSSYETPHLSRLRPRPYGRRSSVRDGDENDGRAKVAGPETGLCREETGARRKTDDPRVLGDLVWSMPAEHPAPQRDLQKIQRQRVDDCRCNGRRQPDHSKIYKIGADGLFSRNGSRWKAGEGVRGAGHTTRG